MTISWTVFLSTGMLFARRKEGPFPLFTSISIALFQYHRTLNLTGIAGTVFGFICILIANDWSSELVGAPIHESNWRWGSIHSLVGLIACVVAWIQPLDSMLRCSFQSLVLQCFFTVLKEKQKNWQ
ncbi:unnamed protein product [Heligmosomoides polygyrus]|uniref:Cytochrome b561 domain-containing protein n=1 Tax=Heligmosomoides polygyrus TaxID=6339 RepID=A0A183FF98_HELPZ|nr:unnamed protein product [Heligmosomoides polygyrus]